MRVTPTPDQALDAVGDAGRQEHASHDDEGQAKVLALCGLV